MYCLFFILFMGLGFFDGLLKLKLTRYKTVKESANPLTYFLGL